MDDDALLAEQRAYCRAGSVQYDRQYAEYEVLQRLLATNARWAPR